MKNFIRYAAIAAASAVVLTVALPSFAQSTHSYGTLERWLGKRDGIDRVVTLAPDTRSVNVVAGETVQFVERRTGQNFVYDFSNERRSYDLGALAPTGMFGAGKVMVHVFAASPAGSNVLGRLGDSGIYNRVITITPTTRWINVAQTELVKIVDAQTGQSFVWNFDGRWDWGRMDLSDVVPPGILSREHVMAYVADQPARDDTCCRH